MRTNDSIISDGRRGFLTTSDTMRVKTCNAAVSVRQSERRSLVHGRRVGHIAGTCAADSQGTLAPLRGGACTSSFKPMS
jgi:hypothetical protein